MRGMLELVPISLKEANAFVERNHRHHKPVTGHKFSVAAAMDGEIVGVAIVGRPVSRYLDDGWTLEVNRWSGKRKPKVDLYPAQMKLRFEMEEKWGIRINEGNIRVTAIGMVSWTDNLGRNNELTVFRPGGTA